MYYVELWHDKLPCNGRDQGHMTRFFTARRYANAVYAVVVCPSICLSVFFFVRPSLTAALCQNG